MSCMVWKYLNVMNMQIFPAETRMCSLGFLDESLTESIRACQPVVLLLSQLRLVQLNTGPGPQTTFKALLFSSYKMNTLSVLTLKGEAHLFVLFCQESWLQGQTRVTLPCGSMPQLLVTSPGDRTGRASGRCSYHRWWRVTSYRSSGEPVETYSASTLWTVSPSSRSTSWAQTWGSRLALLSFIK